jgi:hypothetical protein
MATPEIPTPAAPAPIGDVGRMTGVLFSPSATYQDIVARPTWITPLLLLLVLSIAVVGSFSQRVGWRSFMEKQFDKDPRVAQLSPQDRQARLDASLKFVPPIVYVSVVIGTFVVPVIIAAILMGAFNLMAGTRVNFKTALAIVAFSWMPFVIHGLLSLVLMFLKSPDAIDLEHLVASNPGAFLSSDASKWLMTLATAFDVFTLWVIVLEGIGFSATNPKKASVAKGVTIVFVCWAILVVIKVAWAAAFS